MDGSLAGSWPVASGGAAAVDAERVVAFRRGAHGREQLHRVGEWREAVARLAARLAERAPSPGARVALFDDDPYAFSIGLFACWQRGAIAVLPPNDAPGSLERLRDGVVAAVGGRGDWLPGVDGLAPLEPVTGTEPDEAWRALEREAPALELFTSGTTGDGKAAPKRLRHLDDEVATLERTFGAGLDGARVYATASHQHLYGLLFRVLWPIAAGRPFCCDRLLHAEELLPRLEAEPRAVLASVPAHLARLAASRGLARLSAERSMIFSSGGPLAAATAHAFERTLGDAPIEVFGSTETGGVAWRRQRAGLGDAARWSPFDGVTVRIDEADGRLRVRSPAVSENEEAGFAMGDRATLEPDGRFVLGGRADRVVKIGEKRLELAEMESRLREHVGVERAALVPVEQRGGTRLGAVVVASEHGREAVARDRAGFGRELADHLARDFDRVLVPRQFRYVAALPEDAQGKTTAAALRALFESRREEGERPLEPAWGPVIEGAGWREREGIVPADLRSLEGHFPGAPIVAGTVQLDWAVELARVLIADLPEHRGVPRRLIRVEALKFPARLVPGQTCVLRVDRRERGEPGRVHFRLFARAGSDEHDFASGRLVFA